MAAMPSAVFGGDEGVGLGGKVASRETGRLSPETGRRVRVGEDSSSSLVSPPRSPARLHGLVLLEATRPVRSFDFITVGSCTLHLTRCERREERGDVEPAAPIGVNCAIEGRRCCCCGGGADHGFACSGGTSAGCGNAAERGFDDRLCSPRIATSSASSGGRPSRKVISATRSSSPNSASSIALACASSLASPRFRLVSRERTSH